MSKKSVNGKCSQSCGGMNLVKCAECGGSELFENCGLEGEYDKMKLKCAEFVCRHCVAEKGINDIDKWKKEVDEWKKGIDSWKIEINRRLDLAENKKLEMEDK